jgi:hypothetical protein
VARARNIKPGFFKNEDLAECSFPARLLFAGLWTLADREGRLEDRPKRIKAELFAFDSIEVEPLMKELAKQGFILRYTVGAQALIQIIAFAKHQNPHHREPESELPPPQSPGLQVVAITQKPEALPALHEDEAPGQAEEMQATDDMARGSSRADSGFSDSGNLIPDTRPPDGTAAGTVTLALLVAEGIDPQHARDWLKARKTKHLPLTQTAWARFKSDALKAGYEPGPAVELCAGKGWAGFYVDKAKTACADDIFAGAR